MEKCPVKVWPVHGPIMPRRCTRSAGGERGLCLQHEKMLDRYKELPLMDGGNVTASGKRYPRRQPGVG